MTASSQKLPSVTSGSRTSVQPAKPALPIRFLCEELPNVYVFSAHKMFTTFCAPFANRTSHLGLCFRSICAVHCSHEPKGALCFP